MAVADSSGGPVLPTGISANGTVLVENDGHGGKTLFWQEANSTTKKPLYFDEDGKAYFHTTDGKKITGYDEVPPAVQAKVKEFVKANYGTPDKWNGNMPTAIAALIREGTPPAVDPLKCDRAGQVNDSNGIILFCVAAGKPPVGLVFDGQKIVPMTVSKVQEEIKEVKVSAAVMAQMWEAVYERYKKIDDKDLTQFDLTKKREFMAAYRAWKARGTASEFALAGGDEPTTGPADTDDSTDAARSSVRSPTSADVVHGSMASFTE